MMFFGMGCPCRRRASATESRYADRDWTILVHNRCVRRGPQTSLGLALGLSQNTIAAEAPP
jgi:hypothetical protein